MLFSFVIRKRLFALLAIFLLTVTYSVAQTSVGINTTTPSPNAVLQLVSPGNNQGFLVPKLTTVQRTNATFISSLTVSDNGLLVYDETENTFYYWLNSAWQKVSNGDLPNLLQVLTSGNSAGTNRIINLGDPVNAQDAVTKIYVDAITGDIYNDINNLRDSIVDIFDTLQVFRDSIDNISSTIVRLDTTIYDIINNNAALPDQTGNAGRYLSTDGTNPFWSLVPGGADMYKSDYDANNNNRVDNADYDNTISGLTANDTKAAIDEVEGRVDNAETNITTIQGDITNLDNRVTTVEGDITALDGRVTTVEGDITTMQGDITNLDNRVTTVEGDITALDGRVTNVEGDITTIQGDITNLDNRVTTVEGDITNLDNRVTTVEGDITALDGRVTNVEGDITTIQGDITNLDNRVTTVEGDITNLDNRVTTVEGDITNLDNRVTTIEGDITTIQGDITNLDNRVTTVEGDISNLQTNVTNLYDSVLNFSSILENGTFNLADGSIFVGDVNDTARAVVMTGDVIISNTGVTTITQDAIIPTNFNGIPDNGIPGYLLATDGDGTFSWADPTSISIDPNSITLPTGQILIGDATNNAAAITMNGDATMDASGDFQLGIDVVTAAEIAADAVTASEITTGAVATAEILDGTIQDTDLDVPAVGTNGQILTSDGAGGFAWISQGGLTSLPELTDVNDAAATTNGNILVADGAQWNSVAQSGDVIISNAGNVQIQADAVGSAEIAADAVTASEIATGAVATAEILDGTIQDADMGLTSTLTFEGSVADAFETVISITNPTADNTITLPDATGTVALTSQLPTAANPTGTIGLAAVNGTATTFMRSDAAPALSQAITPTWTGAHTWSALGTFNLGLNVSGAAINLNNNSNFAVNIGTGTSTGTVTIGNATNVINLPALTASKVVFTDASKNLTSTGTLGVDQGGTGINTYTIGDVLYASGATTLSKLADVAAGSYLRSGGVGAAPVWSTLTLPNASGINTLLYSSAANTVSALATANNGILVTSGTGVPSIGNTVGAALTMPSINLSATTNQVVMQSAGITGTLTWTPTAANKTITLPDATGTVALTSQLPTAANPTGTIGLAAVNGTATTFMRSDAAPALSQAIIPTWTGAHTWSALGTFNLGLNASGAAVNLNNNSNFAVNIGTGTSTGAVTIGNAANVVNLPALTASKVVFTDASKNLTSTGTLGVDQGGTGINTYTIGDMLYASGATTLSKLADVAAGSYLRSGGVGAAPVWSTLTLPNASGVNTLLYSSAANTVSALATANNGILVTSGTGVPSIGNTVGAALTMPSINLSATSNQVVMQSAGITGTLTWTPAASNKTITLPNATGTVALTADIQTYTAGEGMSLATNTFSFKNSASLTNNYILKWDDGGTQLVNSTIQDDGAGHVRVGAGAVDVNYNCEITGSFKTAKIYHSSDARWKMNINTIDNALNKVLSLRGVTYDWRINEFPQNNFSEGTQIGLIAQEVEKVIPELVNTGSDGYKAVEYANLVAVLIEAIKEQQKIIDTQTAQIAELKAENGEMSSKLDQIEILQKQVEGLQTQMASLTNALLLLNPSASIQK